MGWDPNQYHRFRSERERPFWDLLALVRPAPAMRVVDLGCGTGELTRAVHEKLAAVETVGIDRADAMLERAILLAGKGLSFRRGAIEDFSAAGAYDLVFSNAALQWVDHHPALLARLARALRPGGQLAVQVPANHDHPSHVAAALVAREEPFARELSGWVRRSPVLAPEEYARILYALGFEEQKVRLEVYPHLLARREEVVEWVKGTLLTAYQERLSPESYARFLQSYWARLQEMLPDERPFFFPFKRVLFWAGLPGGAR